MKHLNIKLILTLLFSFVCINVFSIEVENEDGIVISYWTNSTGLTVQSIVSLPPTITSDDYELKIPESITYNGNVIPVTNIDIIESELKYRMSKLYIPKSIKGISGTFSENLKNIIFENISGIVYNVSSIFSHCKLENVVVNHFDKDAYHRFGTPYTSGQYDIFSENTYKQANLFVPVGTWADFAYTTTRIPGWSNFVHIREMAMNTQELSESRAYTLLDTKKFGFYVYDAVNNRITLRGTHANIDESNPNNSWQIIKNSNNYYLYNIGAKRYATISSNGVIYLSTVPIALAIKNDKYGITIGNGENKYAFLLNDNISIDYNVTAIEDNISNEFYTKKIFNLNGLSLKSPQKGINIINTKNGKTKKVIVK